MPDHDTLLEIRGLTVGYQSNGGIRPVVRDVSLTIEAGETLGLVGESGSGKTTLALALLRSLPASGQVLGGEVRWLGRDLLALTVAEMRTIWGSQIGFVPQDPARSLNPAIRVGEQLTEAIRYHDGLDGQTADDRAQELLQMVRIARPEQVVSGYPHQLSGGMQQRVLLAMALSLKPKLLVLDEPLSSLDATTQVVILDLIEDLIRVHGTAALYVSHHLNVLAQICQRLAVLYAGELVEVGPMREVYRKPLYPYTQAMLDCVPRVGTNKQDGQLRPIPGRLPPPGKAPTGCIFQARCPLAVDACQLQQPLQAAGEGRLSRCHRWQEIADGTIDPRQPETARISRAATGTGRQALQARQVTVDYPQQVGVLEWLQRTRRRLRAVDHVDLQLIEGNTLGVVGESGSGKTSLARALLGLAEHSSGALTLLGEQLPGQISNRSGEQLAQVQAVFQHPDESLNPYLTVRQTLTYPLRHLRNLSPAEAEGEMLALLRAVQLDSTFADRLPDQLSGGEKQRVAVARAFAAEPAVLIADEALSSLDVSVRASLLNLLQQMQTERDSAHLLISHDLAAIGFVSDQIAVMYLGQFMQVASGRSLFEPPYHPYTEALLSAVPLIDPEAQQQRIRLAGELPDPTEFERGCPFHSRCPRALGRICVEETPPWQRDAGGKLIFCHIPLQELQAEQQRVFQFEADDS